MAYLNFLIAAPEADVLALACDATFLLEPSLIVGVSHLISYWVETQPLGELLDQALDRGLAVNADLWHPLRSSTYHPPDAVRVLGQRLVETWSAVLSEMVVTEDDWYRVEIEKVIRLFRHAAERNECVVSILQPPADRERARRVAIPFRWK